MHHYTYAIIVLNTSVVHLILVAHPTHAPCFARDQALLCISVYPLPSTPINMGFTVNAYFNHARNFVRRRMRFTADLQILLRPSVVTRRTYAAMTSLTN